MNKYTRMIQEHSGFTVKIVQSGRDGDDEEIYSRTCFYHKMPELEREKARQDHHITNLHTIRGRNPHLQAVVKKQVFQNTACSRNMHNYQNAAIRRLWLCFGKVQKNAKRSEVLL